MGARLRADYGSIRVGDETSVQENVVIHARKGEATRVGSRVQLGHVGFLGVDLGLFEPGPLDLGTPSFRGWSGSERREVTVTAAGATPGARAIRRATYSSTRTSNGRSAATTRGGEVASIASAAASASVRAADRS